mmetsp:Transcript_11791/g.37494  ORF Transcript_11791/g.37494 Transcript_11791/m.37494 type:complete len:127 (-) Transcript_11791:607-987(-)
MDGGARSASVARKAYMDAAFTPGRTFARIVEELSKCGYAVSWRVVSAKEWLPQQRERVYLVGFRRDLGVEMRWDGVRGGKPSSTLRDVLESPRRTGGRRRRRAKHTGAGTNRCSSPRGARRRWRAS